MLRMRPHICDDTAAEINLKYRNKTNFADCFAWVWNLVSHIEGGAWVEGVLQYGDEERTWAYEERGCSGVEKTT
jgi:hypothetical protein